MAPMMSARPSDGASGSAVIDTRPARAPFSTMVKVDLAVEELRQDQRRDGTGGRGHVGVGEECG